jgi:hypothetical protein
MADTMRFVTSWRPCVAGLFHGFPDDPLGPRTGLSPVRPEDTVLGSYGNVRSPATPQRAPVRGSGGRLASILGPFDDHQPSGARRVLPVAEKIENPMKDSRVLDSFPKSVTITDKDGVQVDVTSEYRNKSIRQIIDDLVREPRASKFDIIGTDPHPSEEPRSPNT